MLLKQWTQQWLYKQVKGLEPSHSPSEATMTLTKETRVTLNDGNMMPILGLGTYAAPDVSIINSCYCCFCSLKASDAVCNCIMKGLATDCHGAPAISLI